MNNELIGQDVRFSIDKEKHSIGKVVDKITMTHTSKESVTVTGYLIEERQTGVMYSIQHWRIKQILRN